MKAIYSKIQQNLQDQELQQEKIKKWDTYEIAYALYEGQQLILNAFRRGIFPIKEKD